MTIYFTDIYMHASKITEKYVAMIETGPKNKQGLG